MRISISCPEDKLSRTERLLALLQHLRRHRRPVTAAELAQETGVSLRTIYRDLATLAAQGAVIEGEAGVGYMLRDDYFLPPLAFTADEVDALIMGLRWVSGQAGGRPDGDEPEGKDGGEASGDGDEALGRAARDALAKIIAVLPDGTDDAVAGSGLIPVPEPAGGHLGTIRLAIRAERKLRVRYADKKGHPTERIVWPVAVGFFTDAEMLAAWCELRRAFRHFRLDRITGVETLEDRYPIRRAVLLADWRLAEGIDPNGY